jgi:hypothetical protein
MIAGVEAADDLITSQAKFGTCTATTTSGAPQPTASSISPDQIYKVILGWCLRIRVKVKLKPRGKTLGLFRTVQSAQNSSTSTVVELSHDSSDLYVLKFVIIQIDGKVRAVYVYQSLRKPENLTILSMPCIYIFEWSYRLRELPRFANAQQPSANPKCPQVWTELSSTQDDHKGTHSKLPWYNNPSASGSLTDYHCFLPRT